MAGKKPACEGVAGGQGLAYCERTLSRDNDFRRGGHERLLFISGQIPADRDGNVPAGFEAQARACWTNLLAQLEAANMGVENLIKVTVFLKRYEDRGVNAKVRFEVRGEHRPALSTVITDVYDPDWLLEIEAIAAG
jgi:2-iminobutanoate/2-iminopropanoate deaminase